MSIMDNRLLYEALPSNSFLEYAFLRWVLSPSVTTNILERVFAQNEVRVNERKYFSDYEIVGDEQTFVIELDGYEFHGNRRAFSYDRLRQNDLQSTGRIVVRFSYDSIRTDTARCVSQLQSVLFLDSSLREFLISNPYVEKPDMFSDSNFALSVSPTKVAKGTKMDISYFDLIRGKINKKPLRECQIEAFSALGNYYTGGGNNAAVIMSVGAGKTALGVLTCLAFTKRRAMVVTPSRIIRSTFDRAFDYEALGNVLYGLPSGPIIPGQKPPKVITLDSDDGPIQNIEREELLEADIILTNFHSLGTGESDGDILSKLDPNDIDMIVIDEAHIAAADSYQRTFRHFSNARTLLMSACFQRLDGKPIDADVVYRYRLIDSIADGSAKNIFVQRFISDSQQTRYEMVWPDGSREEIVGKDAILDILKNEKKLSRVTAMSDEPIRQTMQLTKLALDNQTKLLNPVKPRVLFSAIGKRHAEQISRIANEYGISSDYVHYSMPDSKIKEIRDNFERDSGGLQGLVQLKMFGQGYDFPPICIVVPMRPYGSFSEFYQFIGRDIRVINHPSLAGRFGPGEQKLDIIYHSELGLDGHIDTIYTENDMDPLTIHDVPDISSAVSIDRNLPGTTGYDVAQRPETFVLFEQGKIDKSIIHDEIKVEQRRAERKQEALAQQYSEYASSSPSPVTFQQFIEIKKQLDDE